jgi:hypothetical protein
MKIFLIAILVVGLCSCSKQKDQTTTVDCSGPAKSFLTDVNPIIQSTCNDDSGCHGAGSNNGPGELLNYSKIFNARASIRSAIASGEMPLNTRLTSSQKNSILCWIDNGAPNN